jgi:hypothetical protein
MLIQNLIATTVFVSFFFVVTYYLMRRWVALRPRAGMWASWGIAVLAYWLVAIFSGANFAGSQGSIEIIKVGIISMLSILIFGRK